MYSRNLQAALFVVATLTGSLAASPSRAALVLSIEAPGVQSSTVSNVITENFNGFSPGNYSSLDTAVGVLTSAGAFAIQPVDSYGGAGGVGNYFSVGVQSGSAAPATLELLNGPQAYFGFWWSAADRNNQIMFYSGNQLLGSFDSAAVLGALSGGYYGNPNGRGDGGEPFAYVNVVGTNGTTITSVVFANSGATDSGFESDNWSIAASVPTSTPRGTVVVGGIATPEPSSLILVGTALAIGVVLCKAGGSRSKPLHLASFLESTPKTKPDWPACTGPKDPIEANGAL